VSTTAESWDLRQEADAARRVIERIDYDGRQVLVNLTKDRVRDAPDCDAARDQDEAYRSELGAYYGPFWWPCAARRTPG
jgi:YD repeat-containing protein